MDRRFPKTRTRARESVSAPPAMGVHRPAQRSKPAAPSITILNNDWSDANPVTDVVENGDRGSQPETQEAQLPASHGRRWKIGAAKQDPYLKVNQSESRGETPMAGWIFTLSSDYSSMMPRFNPMVTAWVRSFAPNLSRMFFTRLLTVSSVIESCAAICLLALPAAISRSTSISLAVNPSSPVCSTSWAATSGDIALRPA